MPGIIAVKELQLAVTIEGERAWLQRGSMRFEVPAGQLRRVDSRVTPTVEVRVPPAPEGLQHEISLLGLRAKEAVTQLDDFLARIGYFPSRNNWIFRQVRRAGIFDGVAGVIDVIECQFNVRGCFSAVG